MFDSIVRRRGSSPKKVAARRIPKSTVKTPRGQRQRRHAGAAACRRIGRSEGLDSSGSCSSGRAALLIRGGEQAECHGRFPGRPRPGACYGIFMFVLQALFTWLIRSLGKIFQALFGWSVLALYGPLPKREK